MGWRHKFVIPTGAKHRNEAMKFLKYIAADPQGSMSLALPISWYPAYKKSEVYSVYKKGELTAPYVAILEKAAHTRPIMPAAQKYWDELDAAVNSVIQGKKEAAPALASVTKTVQVELDRILAKYSKRK